MDRRPWKTIAGIVVSTGVLVLGWDQVPASAGDSPGTARALSVVLPGAGHLYAGEGVTGVEILSVFAGSLATAVAVNPGTWEEKDTSGPFSDLSGGTSTTTKLLFWGSAVVAAGSWLYAVVDAPKAVGRQLAIVPVVEPGLVRLALSITF